MGKQENGFLSAFFIDLIFWTLINLSNESHFIDDFWDGLCGCPTAARKHFARTICQTVKAPKKNNKTESFSRSVIAGQILAK